MKTLQSLLTVFYFISFGGSFFSIERTKRIIQNLECFIETHVACISFARLGKFREICLELKNLPLQMFRKSQTSIKTTSLSKQLQKYL